MIDIQEVLNTVICGDTLSEGLEPHCSYCGCDDVRLLEVNHRFGGGGVKK